MSDDASPIKPFAEPSNLHWLQFLAAGLMQEEIMKHIVALVREEFGLGEPTDEEDIALNERCDRAAIAERVAETATETIWPPPVLHLLNFVFRPEELCDLFRPNDDTDEPAVADEERRQSELAGELAVALFEGTGMQRVLADMVIRTVADYAITGDIRPPTPLLQQLVGGVFRIPLLDDSMTLTVTSRFSDLDAQIAELRRLHNSLYKTSDRNRRSADPERGMWVAATHTALRDSQDRSSSGEALYDRLLTLFEQSPWGHELLRYDLDTPEGQRRAKTFLKQIVHRQHTKFRAVIASADQSRREVTERQP